MRVVVDTNVLVAGLLTPHGTYARILDAIYAGDLTPVYDDRMIDEYEEVLTRPRFKLPRELVKTMIDYLRIEGEQIDANLLPGLWPDPTDAMFVEVAYSARVDALITGNKKHFPKKLTPALRVLSPRGFLSLF